METSTIEQYLTQISRTPLLSDEAVRQLSARALAGDERAVSRLVEANLRFVVSIARTYQREGLDILDLISEGNIGLVAAARSFDASRGPSFPQYAAPHIRRHIERALKREKDAVAAQSRGDGQRRSLDAPLGAKPNISLLSVLTDDASPIADTRLFSQAQEEATEQALGVLDSREQQVIAAYFGTGQERLTMAEIAEDMGLKRERVRQIRDKAVRKMRKAYREATK